MVDILLKNDFRAISAGAFIGQHSYFDIVPVAMGRPDSDDLDKALCFGKNSIKFQGCLSLEKIPVQSDIFSRSDKYMPLKPTFIPELCIQCGLCADVCPMGVLSPETGTFLNPKDEYRCIGCVACVSKCSRKARIAKTNAVMKLLMKYILRKAAVERQEPLMIYSHSSINGDTSGGHELH